MISSHIVSGRPTPLNDRSRRELVKPGPLSDVKSELPDSDEDTATPRPHNDTSVLTNLTNPESTGTDRFRYVSQCFDLLWCLIGGEHVRGN